MHGELFELKHCSFARDDRFVYVQGSFRGQNTKPQTRHPTLYIFFRFSLKLPFSLSRLSVPCEILESEYCSFYMDYRFEYSWDAKCICGGFDPQGFFTTTKEYAIALEGGELVRL